MQNLGKWAVVLQGTFDQLIKQTSKIVGKNLYSYFLNSEQWGIYPNPYVSGNGNKNKNIGFAQPRAGSVKSHVPPCLVPNLRISVDVGKANKAGITCFEATSCKANRGRPEGYWCMPQNDTTKIKQVAGYLSKIY